MLSVPHVIEIPKDSKKTLLKVLKKCNTANIVNDKTYFKSLDNSSFIDLFITSWRLSNTTAFSKGLSHFHKMAVTVLKAPFSKVRLRDMLHRDYKNFEQDKFKHEFKNIIQNGSVECYYEFENFFVNILNKWVRPFK